MNQGIQGPYFTCVQCGNKASVTDEHYAEGVCNWCAKPAHERGSCAHCKSTKHTTLQHIALADDGACAECGASDFMHYNTCKSRGKQAPTGVFTDHGEPTPVPVERVASPQELAQARDAELLALAAVLSALETVASAEARNRILHYARDCFFPSVMVVR